MTNRLVLVWWDDFARSQTAGDRARLAALLRILAHGPTDPAAAGHLAAEGEDHADARDLLPISSSVVTGTRTSHGSRPWRRAATTASCREWASSLTIALRR